MGGRALRAATTASRLSEDPLRLLLTASGKDKGALTRDDFVLVDENGEGIEPDGPKPSAETMLHVVLARHAGAGAVLHTHSVWGTVLSDRHATAGRVTLSGYEILKALPGISTHDTSISIPVFPIHKTYKLSQKKWASCCSLLRIP